MHFVLEHSKVVQVVHVDLVMGNAGEEAKVGRDIRSKYQRERLLYDANNYYMIRGWKGIQGFNQDCANRTNEYFAKIGGILREKIHWVNGK